MKTIQSLTAMVLVAAAMLMGTAQAKAAGAEGEKPGGNNSWFTTFLPRAAKVEDMAKAPALVRRGEHFVLEVTSDTYGFSTVEVLSGTGRVIRSIPVTLDKGINHLRFAVKDLNPGVHFIRITADETIITRAFDVR